MYIFPAVALVVVIAPPGYDIDSIVIPARWWIFEFPVAISRRYIFKGGAILKLCVVVIPVFSFFFMLEIT
jgi:hypothetical protein